MSVLCFYNPGEIDPRLITTMGVNVKEGDSPIGHFGTGLKYAIAIVLRLGGNLRIQSGKREFTFSLAPATIRGKTFDFIEMKETDGASQTLAFTTELGKDWLPWMAYREFLCNARDEGGAVELLSKSVSPAKGSTRILVEEPLLEEIYRDQKKEWLLDTKQRLLWRTPAIECYLGSSTCGYYRGIKVVEFGKPTAVTYNILAQTNLTEDRTMPHYRFTHIVTTEIVSRNRPAIPLPLLNRLVAPNSDYAENDFYWTIYTEPRQEILDNKHLNRNLREAIRPYLPPPHVKRSVFDDLQSASPAIPHYTCPYINKIQAKIEESLKQLAAAEETAPADLPALCAAVASTLADLLDDGDQGSDLEMLRSLNEALRSSGVYWREECKRLTSHLPSSHAEDEQAA